MKIEDLKVLANYTNSKATARLLLDEDDDFIRQLLDVLVKNKIKIENQDDFRTFIKFLKQNKTILFNSDVYGITKNCKDKSLKEIIELLRFYEEENFIIEAYNYIITLGNTLDLENLKRIYNACKKIGFSIDIDDCPEWDLDVKDKHNTLFDLRITEEIIMMLDLENDLFEKNLKEVMFDWDVLKYRTFNESIKLKDIYEKISDERFSLEKDEYELDNDDYMDMIHNIITNEHILKKMTLDEQINLIRFLDYSIEEVKGEIYKLIEKMSSIDMSFSGQKQLLQHYSTNKSPFIFDTIMDNLDNIYDIGIGNFTNSLEEMNEPVMAKEELTKSKDLNDFINTLEENNIEEFNGESMIYKLYKPKKINNKNKKQ